MPVEFGLESNYAKEMRKHEAYPTQFGPGQRPYVFTEFPKMVYRAAYVKGEGFVITERRTVDDATGELNMKSRGFFAHQEDALKAAEAEQTEHATLAAEREWQIQHGRISERATAEVRRAEAEVGAVHLPDVPETPIKKRGRPAKQASA